MAEQDDAGRSRRERVGEKADHLWRDAGSPPPGPDAYRDLASELIAIEEAEESTRIPVDEHRAGPFGEPVEPAKPVENLGEFPTISDEGEQEYPPSPPDPPERNTD